MLPSFAQVSRTLLGSTALLAALTLAAPASAASTNATVNLIQLLIKNKVITKDAGEALLAQAEAEAAEARAAEAKRAPPVAVAGAAAAGAALPPPAPGTIRVPHIPEAMRVKITEDIKKEVLAQAEAEGWAASNQVPDWVKGVTLYGDVRFRNESQFYSENNAEELIDFERFNEISPVDINANTNPTGFPLLNTRTNRPSRFRLRARLGLKADLGELAQIGFRLATGDDRSPISTNQVLGGGLTKKDIWLDQGYLRLTPVTGVTASFGRFANPFRNGSALFDTAELIFDNDLNFDGVAVKVDAQQWLDDDMHLALTAGAFPLGFTSPTFPDNSTVKANDSASKWLFSAQLRGGYRFGEGGLSLDASVAYHSFKGVQGQLSVPCALFNGNTQCSTDQFRPDAVRKGNTLFFLRDIAPDPASPTNFAQPQLIGLAFDYDVFDVEASVEVPISKGIDAVVSGQYINNLSAKRSDLCRFAPKGLPINNLTIVDPVAGAAPGTPGADFYTNPCTPDATGRIASYNGGNQGYLIRGVVGVPEPKKFGDWNVELSYRYIETDATVDAFSDSDFHLGGTNAKGYAIGGSFGLAKGVFMTGRWLSANQISGPPLAIDVLQIDLVAGVLTMRRAGLFLALLAAVPAAATPLEDRLREQLQSTTTQLRAAQAQQAVLEAGKAAAEAERDALKVKTRASDPAASRELAAARAQTSALRGELDAGKTALADANRRAANATARLTVAETELAQARATATEATSRQAAALQQCVDANARLVTTGRDLVALHIKRYGRREFPPLQLQRTKIENEAQAMADRVNADTIILNATPDMPK